jgi:hypothetical protein
VVENERAEFSPIQDFPGSGHPDGLFTGFAVSVVKWYVLTLCVCRGGGEGGQHIYFFRSYFPNYNQQTNKMQLF